MVIKNLDGMVGLISERKCQMGSFENTPILYSLIWEVL